MNNIIGKRINEALAARNIKQKELANKIGVKDNVVSYWCNGNRIPNTEQIIQISDALKVSTDFLLGKTNAKTSDKDIQYICDYTGLKEETVNFFAFNKSIEKDTDFNKTAIDFIEFLIDKIDKKALFSISIETLREMTTILFMEYKRGIEFKNTIHTMNEGESVADAIKRWEYERQLISESIDSVKDTVNAQKYTLCHIFNNCLDEFAISNINDCSVSDFEDIENSYYKKGSQNV